jgi:putative ABC transport system permease protein
MLTSLLTDLRYALRGLLARPLFALVAILSLALGIGVNTAIFSLFQQVVLRPLPVAEPDRLVNIAAPGIKTGSTSSGGAGSREEILSYPMFRDLQQQLPAQFTGLVGHKPFSATVGWQQHSRKDGAALVSGNYFAVLGLQPSLGRLLEPRDDADGGSAVAVLAHAYWLNQLGGRSDVVGQAIRVNGELLTVVGVAPAGFSGTSPGNRVELFAPLALAGRVDRRTDPELDNRKNYWLYAFARLAPGVSLEAAQAALNLPYGRLIREVELPLHGELDALRQQEFAAKQLLLSPGARGQSVSARNAVKPLALLFGVAALVLLIACLNIANLLLARGAGRAGEFAIRASIGASRARLLRQLLAEALLIALAGAVLSLPLAATSTAAIIGWLPGSATDLFERGLDPSALAFAGAVALATVLLFGLFPALQLARATPVAALRGESGQAGSRGGNRFRAALATGQVAFSMVSLALAGLFTLSLLKLADEELGMQVETLSVFSVAPGRNGYVGDARGALYERIEEALVALPGVSGVTSSLVPLLSNSEWGTNVAVEGFETSAETLSPNYSMVGDGFFSMMGMTLLAGRDFERADRDGAPQVAVVNRRFAEYFGLGAQPVGKRMATGDGGPDGTLEIEIIGLVEDSKYHDVKAAPYPLFFLPWRQRPGVGEMSFYVRSTLPPETLLPQLAAAVAAIDPALPVEDLRTVPEQIARTLVMERFVGLLSAAFALLSTLLAALGLYGVLSYTLAQRTREIGLRLALGAAPRRLAAMLLGQVARMTVVGGLLGLGIALFAGRAAQSLLFGVDGQEPAVLAAAALLLALVALGAGLLPARRATRTDPMVALRHE